MTVRVRKWTKIRNQYNQKPHPTQDSNGKVTTSQLDITKERQEVSPFPAGDHECGKLLIRAEHAIVYSKGMRTTL